MSKREAKKLMTNSNLIDKKRCTIKNFNFIFFFFQLYMKMKNATYYQRNRYVAINKAKEYYKNNNERLKK